MVCVPPISESSPFDSSPAGSDTGILACLQTAKIQVESENYVILLNSSVRFRDTPFFPDHLGEEGMVFPTIRES